VLDRGHNRGAYESLCLERQPYGIKVVTIAPDQIATPLTAVNRYTMLFFPATPEAARCFAKAIERGVTCTAIPLPTGIVAKVLRMLPNWLCDRLFRCAPREARGLQQYASRLILDRLGNQ